MVVSIDLSLAIVAIDILTALIILFEASPQTCSAIRELKQTDAAAVNKQISVKKYITHSLIEWRFECDRRRVSLLKLPIVTIYGNQAIEVHIWFISETRRSESVLCRHFNGHIALKKQV